MGIGHNNSTAHCLESGYYPGDDLVGLTVMNSDGSDRITLSTDIFRFINVVNDRIYALNHENIPVSMNLDGGDTRVLHQTACQFLFVDKNFIYFMEGGEFPVLCRIQHDNAEYEIIIGTPCYEPIILNDDIFYMDEKKRICHYNTNEKKNIILCEKQVNSYNVMKDHIYFTDGTGIWKMSIFGEPDI